MLHKFSRKTILETTHKQPVNSQINQNLYIFFFFVFNVFLKSEVNILKFQPNCRDSGMLKSLFFILHNHYSGWENYKIIVSNETRDVTVSEQDLCRKKGGLILSQSWRTSVITIYNKT